MVQVLIEFFRNRSHYSYSGLRGAIAYAVSLHLDIADQEHRRAIITTSLCVVLFTILVLGGSTYPLVKWLNVSATR